MRTRQITVNVETEAEIYIFKIYRDDYGQLLVKSQKDLPRHIQVLLDDLWAGHAPSSI
jgi:hypothetical protein